TVRARRRSPAPHRSSTHLVGLAVDRDPLSAHLIGRRRRRIAIRRDRLAARNDLFAGAAAGHARRGCQRYCPHFALAAYRDERMRILVFRGDDRASNRDRLLWL